MSIVTIYNHKIVEKDLYDFWKRQNLFDPIKKQNDKANFSVILPPPNITGHLHLGHAWDGTLQDVIIRYKKLCGYRTVWIPGTDHAGIATQTKFEKILKEKGIDRKSLSDAKFLQQLHDWSKEQAHYIHQQWAKLGFALSYKNEVYSLDKNVANLVNQTFKSLYDQKLIYRAYKLVNWDVSLKTAISDIEVVYRDGTSKLFYFKYQIEGSDEFLEVATARPETMFADVALFVNPKDQRYKKYINKNVVNPINNKLLKVYKDTYVDMEFASGVMKCTPAHDFNDYKLAEKHKITDFVSVLNVDGTLNNHAISTKNNYANIERLAARKLIVDELKQNGSLIKVKEYKNKIAYSERSGEIVEPLLSKQWFVKMAPLVKLTTMLMKKSKPNFIPQRFKKIMDKWLNEVQDWCITRQLLWGHRVPVWYKGKSITVGKPPKKLLGWTQDKDVLDTWFSSGLWPVALTIENNLKDFYPINMLVTGYDILFFWVARMFFQCGNISKQIPLKNILFHGLIRDEFNRKMSKSLNNGIDPMKVIDEYGADALRFFLVSTVTVGEDLRYSNEKIKYRWNFINKIWNSHNFLSQFKPAKIELHDKISPINKWIIESFDNVIAQLNKNMDNYNFVVASKYLEKFIWEDFCNHYLEFIKPLLKQKQFYDETITVANVIFKNILIILHPFIPFVTEKIYLSMFADKKSIMIETWPKLINLKNNASDKLIIKTFKNIYDFVRELRIKYKIKQSIQVRTNLITKDTVQIGVLNQILTLFNIKIEVISPTRINNEAIITVAETQIIEYLKEDNPSSTKEEIDKIKANIARLENEIKRSQSILSNQQFLTKAPPEKVKFEQTKYQQYQEQYKENIVIYQSMISKK